MLAVHLYQFIYFRIEIEIGIVLFITFQSLQIGYKVLPYVFS